MTVSHNDTRTDKLIDQVESLRVFCAVEIPSDVRKQISEYVALLGSHLPNSAARWEGAEKLHITLKFFGDIPSQRIEDLFRAVRRAAKAVRPFSLIAGETGVFPPRGTPRVLWLGVRDDSGSLNNLRRALEDECAGAGYTREPRPFHPHLTIARLRTPHGAREAARVHTRHVFQSDVFTVIETLLMRSEVTAGGSRYTTLSRHPLKDTQKAEAGI
ncbi:MAG TPA: RNA 2',3'-cyclic phosphodiesterase [Pyrinomonadaceae bacterium]|nr:RNA 2',3'-cyclic phosphodiesterase [Pyrinomonadaceae bacterium]